MLGRLELILQISGHFGQSILLHVMLRVVERVLGRALRCQGTRVFGVEP